MVARGKGSVGTNVNWPGTPAKPARSSGQGTAKLGGSTPAYRNPSGPARSKVPGVTPPAVKNRTRATRRATGSM